MEFTLSDWKSEDYVHHGAGLVGCIAIGGAIGGLECAIFGTNLYTSLKICDFVVKKFLNYCAPNLSENWTRAISCTVSLLLSGVIAGMTDEKSTSAEGIMISAVFGAVAVITSFVADAAFKKLRAA